MTKRNMHVLALAGLDPMRCDDLEVKLTQYACRLYSYDDVAADYVKRVLSHPVAAAPHVNET